MAAADHLNRSQYRFLRAEDPYVGVTSYRVARGEHVTGMMQVSNKDWETQEPQYHYLPRPSPGSRLPVPLFEMTGGKKPTASVKGLFSTKEDRAAIPTLLGIAQRDAEARGSTLVPSTGLSEHSARLVEGLKQRGLADPSADTNQSNFITWQERRPWRDDYESEQFAEIPSQDVKAGRETMRNFLRRPRRRYQDRPMF